MKEYLKRFNNVGSIIAVTSLVVLILTTVGVEVDNDKVMIIVKALCSIGVILGVLNNSTTPGIDFPTK